MEVINLGFEAFVKLVSDETVIFKKQGSFTGKKGLILLTNRRIIGIEFKYKGALPRKIDGYKKVGFESNINDIAFVDIVETNFGRLGVNITSIYQSIDRDQKISIFFGDNDDANTLYKELSALLTILRDRKEIQKSEKQSKLNLTREIITYFREGETKSSQFLQQNHEKMTNDVLKIINKHL